MTYISTGIIVIAIAFYAFKVLKKAAKSTTEGKCSGCECGENGSCHIE